MTLVANKSYEEVKKKDDPNSMKTIFMGIYNSPEKKSYIIDFSKIYGSDEYTIGKSETFKKYPIFLYHSYYTTEK